MNEEGIKSLSPGGHGSAETDKISAALVVAQRNARAVQKLAENERHRYLYASAEDVIAESKAALASADLSFTRRCHSLRSASLPGLDGQGDVTPRPGVLLLVSYELRHASGQWLAVESTIPVVPGKGRPLDKAVLAARTADLAYTLRDLLLLPRVDYDVDGRDDMHSPPVEVPPPRHEPAPVKTSGDSLIAAWKQQIEDLYQAGDLAGLREVPHALSRLNFTPDELDELAAYYNPRKLEVEGQRPVGGPAA